MPTMRLTMIFASIVSVVLFGAGCYKNTPSVSEPTPSAAEPVPGVTSSTESDSEIGSSSTTAMLSPTKLAFPGVLSAPEVNKKVRIKTNQGEMVVQVDVEMGPRAASNFVYLAKQGFYNGTIFHRVIPGFMIQGGDPTGTGMGGPGYQFPNDEVKNMPTKTIKVQGQTLTAPVYEDGWVAMANAGRDTNGSQFFIMVADYPLPPDYSVFGKVVDGLKVAHKIAQMSRNGADRPDQEVKMLSVMVE